MLVLAVTALLPGAASVVCIPTGIDATVDCSNAAEDGFVAGPPVKRPRTLFSLVFLGGQACLVGGTSTTTIAAMPTECYNPTSNAWVDLAQYDAGRIYFGAAPYINNQGESCTVGGFIAVGVEYAGSFCYRSGTWQDAPSLILTQSRSYHSTFQLGNTWCVTGGIHSSTGAYLNTVECLGSSSFVQLNQLANLQARTSPSVLYIDGLLCLVGGTEPIANVECLDATTAGNIITNRGTTSLANALATNPAVAWRTTNLIPTSLRSAPSYFTLQGRSCVGGGSNNMTVECYQGGRADGGAAPSLVSVGGAQQYRFSGSFVVVSTTLLKPRAFTAAFTVPGTTTSPSSGGTTASSTTPASTTTSATPSATTATTPSATASATPKATASATTTATATSATRATGTASTTSSTGTGIGTSNPTGTGSRSPNSTGSAGTPTSSTSGASALWVGLAAAVVSLCLCV